MPKTPDEIKKGLACCAASIYQCADDCPYRAECRNGQGGKVMNEDALALLQQKEQENTEQAERIQQLEAERDAAVKELKRIGNCLCCEHDNLCTLLFPNCVECEKTDCPCHTCEHRSNWEWRGVQKEDDT